MGKVERASFTFSISGEFITQLAKERFFLEGADYEKVLELLLSCMCGTEMSDRKLKRYAEDVLIGRAEFAGNTEDGSFCMRTYGDEDETPKVPECFNIFKGYTKLKKKLKETEKELHKMQEWYAVAMEHVPSWDVNNVLRETDQPIESRYGDSLLSGFMERMLDDEEHTTEDYGWLAPDGTFYAVKWGNHQEWAQQYIEEHFPEAAEDDETDMQVHCNIGLIGAGDYLAEKGWVLLHSPSQGIAEPTKDPRRNYTKAQKEFLYDYYMERNKENKANEIWEE